MRDLAHPLVAGSVGNAVCRCVESSQGRSIAPRGDPSVPSRVTLTKPDITSAAVQHRPKGYRSEASSIGESWKNFPSPWPTPVVAPPRCSGFFVPPLPLFRPGAYAAGTCRESVVNESYENESASGFRFVNIFVGGES